MTADQILEAAETYLASDECERHGEYVRELSAAGDSFEAYWAGSASSSVLRDYRAGRAS